MTLNEYQQHALETAIYPDDVSYTHLDVYKRQVVGLCPTTP